jgi:hypothetical protein
MKMENEVPRALSFWFVVHFAIDMLVALPLFLFPEWILESAGWEEIDPLLTRVVAAAFFAIGIESLIAQKTTLQGFKNMLDLKIIWSLSAMAGIGWAMISGIQGRPPLGWVALGTFALFHILWIYWRIRIGKLLSTDSV